MPVLARLVEAAGIPTVLVTMMPMWSEKRGVARTLAVEYPFGQTFGQPHNIEQQTEVITAALDVLKSASEAGAIVHHAAEWPVPQKEAYKKWQPSEPSPVIEAIVPMFRQMLRSKKS